MAVIQPRPTHILYQCAKFFFFFFFFYYFLYQQYIHTTAHHTLQVESLYIYVSI